MRVKNWRGVRFDQLLDQHATAMDREPIERVIFSKMIDFGRDAKRGKISPAERARMTSRIEAYRRSL
jgi:hypothetical protein